MAGKCYSWRTYGTLLEEEGVIEEFDGEVFRLKPLETKTPDTQPVPVAA